MLTPDSSFLNILNKSENATPELFAIYIYKMMQASKANESVSEYSKTGLCIKVKVLRMLSRGNTQKSFKCDRGPIFQVANLNRNLTWFRPLRNPLLTRSDSTEW